ncbi:hypothetical protein SEA_MACGULLY_79 [Rhodococcus phage MacGully]|nr:hypothetical protein SEA_MACGULLY_79 [Rhodococcus phage MacGully]
MASKQPETQGIEVGAKVQLDTQPFEWTVVETSVGGHPSAVTIKRKCIGELSETLSRTVEATRLRVLG